MPKSAIAPYRQSRGLVTSSSTTIKEEEVEEEEFDEPDDDIVGWQKLAQMNLHGIVGYEGYWEEHADIDDDDDDDDDSDYDPTYIHT